TAAASGWAEGRCRRPGAWRPAGWQQSPPPRAPTRAARSAAAAVSASARLPLVRYVGPDRRREAEGRDGRRTHPGSVAARLFGQGAQDPVRRDRDLVDPDAEGVV